MSPVAILAGQFILVLVGVVLAWEIGRRRLPAAWSTIGWGALAFPLSQLARFALLIPLTFALNPVSGGVDPAVIAGVNAAILVLTSGLFEETARWVVLRFWATRARRWPDGVAFGLGHGGIEAILLLGASAISGIALLATADTALETVRSTAPDQAGALEAQIATLQGFTVGLASLGVYERILAIILHVACSVIVLRGVRESRWQWWLLAVVLHCGFNALALAVNSLGNPLLTEAAITVPVLVLLWALVAGPLSRRRDPGDVGVAADADDVGGSANPA